MSLSRSTAESHGRYPYQNVTSDEPVIRPVTDVASSNGSKKLRLRPSGIGRHPTRFGGVITFSEVGLVSDHPYPLDGPTTVECSTLVTAGRERSPPSPPLRLGRLGSHSVTPFMNANEVHIVAVCWAWPTSVKVSSACCRCRMPIAAEDDDELGIGLYVYNRRAMEARYDLRAST